MEELELGRYEAHRVLGTGADYEVWAAVDRDTGQRVVLKRPLPQTVRHRLHAGIEARTDRLLQVYQRVGHALPTVVPIVGYTDRLNHDAYFGDALEQDYRVIVAERATGIPLVGDPMARITGVPIGLGQNLFVLFPLLLPEGSPSFAIHQQLLDLEETFFQAGYLLLDLRPQNIFYQPGTGHMTVIDCGALVEHDGEPDRRGRPPRTIYDFYLEMLKFYTTSQQPPAQASGYREPYGLRPVVSFEQELNGLAQNIRRIPDPQVHDASLVMINHLRQRDYATFADFRRDLMAYLEAVRRAHQGLSYLSEAREAWLEALSWLHADYWQRYLFDPGTELARFEDSIP